MRSKKKCSITHKPKKKYKMCSIFLKNVYFLHFLYILYRFMYCISVYIFLLNYRHHIYMLTSFNTTIPSYKRKRPNYRFFGLLAHNTFVRNSDLVERKTVIYRNCSRQWFFIFFCKIASRLWMYRDHFLLGVYTYIVRSTTIRTEKNDIRMLGRELYPQLL